MLWRGTKFDQANPTYHKIIVPYELPKDVLIYEILSTNV